MIPPDVKVEHDETANLTTWTRGTVKVSFHPSPDPVVRAAQEADLARHLDQRTQGA
jgi:hypothetical protein